MRVSILAIGGRGDVWPYLAFGLGLQRAGHTVRLATHAEFESSVREIGLGYSRVSGSPREMVESEAGQRWLASGRNTIKFMRQAGAATRPLIDAANPDLSKACLNAEAIIFSPLAFGAAHFAERLGVPVFGGDGVPMGRTQARPHVLMPSSRSLGRPLNLLSHFVLDQVSWQQIRGAVNGWRQETLDLPPLPLLGPEYRRDRVIPMLYAYSAQISPRPRDWPSWRHVTGYWFLDTPADWAPPPELMDFLEAGPPPVWVGFGSMVPTDVPRQTELVVAAVRQAGKRAILQTGWGGLGHGAVGSDIYVTRSVEHHWLFPRVAAVVHHGGGGTTAAGLRAGAPSVLTPFFADQFYWADRVHALGAGPAPISHHQMTVERLASALRTATEDPGIRAGAARVGEGLRSEDGVARAVAAFEDHVREWYGL